MLETWQLHNKYLLLNLPLMFGSHMIILGEPCFVPVFLILHIMTVVENCYIDLQYALDMHTIKDKSE